MTRIQILSALLCVLTISTGQLLFKKSGLEIEAAGTWLSPRVMLIVGFALFLYAATTFFWINLLRYVPLNKASAFMALNFVLVPIASYFVFREPLSFAYFVGAVLMAIGLIVITKFA